jgi:hypothetical protein
MFLILKNIQRLASPKALVRVLPTLLFPLCGKLPEFLFFRFSLSRTYWSCLPVLLSGKRESYFNSKSFTDKELSCLTVLPCLTNRTLNLSKSFFKVQSEVYNFLYRFARILKIFKNMWLNPLVSFIPSHKGRGFLRHSYKFCGKRKVPLISLPLSRQFQCLIHPLPQGEGRSETFCKKIKGMA